MPKRTAMAAQSAAFDYHRPSNPRSKVNIALDRELMLLDPVDFETDEEANFITQMHIRDRSFREIDNV